MRIKQKDWTTGRTVGTLASVWVGSSSLFYPRVRKYDNNVRWVHHMGQLRKSGDLNWFIDWRLISLQEKKNWNGEGRMVLSGRKEWGRKEVEQVIIEKTKALLSGLWQHPLHQVSPPPPPLPSELPIQFHPHERISSTAPSLIYSSIHLSLPPTNGKNNTQ